MLDVLLQSDSDAMLPRFGLAVMEALSSHLLELQDFEEVITYLKVCPCAGCGVGRGRWGVSAGCAGVHLMGGWVGMFCLLTPGHESKKEYYG